MKLRNAFLVLVIACFLMFLSSGLFPTGVRAFPLEPQQGDPAAALNRGRTLLRQGHADQAVGYLDTALNLYTQTNNSRGIAATEDGFGDLYLIQGQYKVALDHYQKAYQSFVTARGLDEKGQGAANAMAGRAGSTASAAAETASSLSDNGFNANLILAKIGDTNYRLGRISEAGSAYLMMSVKKPETVAQKTKSRFGFPSVISSIASGRPSVSAPTTSGAGGLLEIKKELDDYRAAIVFMTYELGTGRIAFANNEKETARKHFQNALDASNESLSGLTNLGQTGGVPSPRAPSRGHGAVAQAA